jgi:hypothetical protein
VLDLRRSVGDRVGHDDGGRPVMGSTLGRDAHEGEGSEVTDLRTPLPFAGAVLHGGTPA